jgi:predicted dehydrogenase
VGVHCIDTLHFILPGQKSFAGARAVYGMRTRRTSTAAALTLEFSRGTLGAVLVSTRADCRTQSSLLGSAVSYGQTDLTIDRPITLHGGETAQSLK